MRPLATWHFKENDIYWLSNLFGFALLALLLGFIGLPEISSKILSPKPETLTFAPGFLFLLKFFSQSQLSIVAKHIPSFYMLGLIGLALPPRRWKIAGGITAGIAAVLALSIRSSYGKIDHVLIIHALPLLAALDLLRNKDDLLFVRTALGFFFLNSFLAKFFGGWVAMDSMAILQWLKQYQVEHGLFTPVGKSLLQSMDLGVPLIYKAMDIVVLLTEGAFAVLFFRLRTQWLSLVLFLLLCIFHIGIYQLLGFPFLALSIPYWWMTKPSSEGPAKSQISWLLTGAILLVLFKYAPVSIYPSLFGLSLLRLCLYTPRVCNSPSRPQYSHGLALWCTINSILLAFSVFHTEAYPNFGGPRFNLNGKAGCTCSYQLGRSPSSKRRPLDELAYRKLKQYALLKHWKSDPAVRCLSHGFVPRSDIDTYLHSMEGSIRNLGISIKVIEKCNPDPRMPKRGEG